MHATDIAAIDGTAVGTVAAEKAFHSRHPKSVEPGSWTVILEPLAFGELLSYIVHHFSAETYDEGSSFLSGGLGEKYVGENVTLSDDYAQKLAPGMPFDYEGNPTRRSSATRERRSEEYRNRRLLGQEATAPEHRSRAAGA